MNRKPHRCPWCGRVVAAHPHCPDKPEGVTAEQEWKLRKARRKRLGA